MRPIRAFRLLPLLMVSAPLMAQIALPPLGGVTRSVDQTIGRTLNDGLSPLRDVAPSAAELARQRLDRLSEFVRHNRNLVELDDQQQPARRGEVIMLDPDPASLSRAAAAGFTVIEQAQIETLGIDFARLRVPEGQRLAQALADIREVLPGKTITADQLYFKSGAVASVASAPPPGAGKFAEPRGGTVGIIDGGLGRNPWLAGQRGFASGAPLANAHASAIASLLGGAGTGKIYCADVYGSDPAGGNALAIARALGWMSNAGVPVASISLVGPSNPLLARAISAAQARGMAIVAAVGNDGPSAPPAYPASYPGVIAVTGIDGQGRVLIEAGRASHLDYAAPGADLTALDATGRRIALRGTSYAAPLAAARIAAHRAREEGNAAAFAGVDREAALALPRANGQRLGRGVLCSNCRRGE